MTKIQFIVDDGKSLKAYRCDEVEINMPTPDYSFADRYKMEQAPKKFYFTAHNVIGDESPTLVSIPDELLLRIRDYNIDTERQNAIKQTFELKKKIEWFEEYIGRLEKSRDFISEELERFENKLDKMIDKYPEVAAEIALEDGNLDAACYFAEKGSKKRRNKNGKSI